MRGWILYLKFPCYFKAQICNEAQICIVALTCRSWHLALKTLRRDLVFALLFEWKTDQFSE